MVPYSRVLGAGEAVEAGAAGLVYMRVKAGGEVDAAKPVLEGLTEQQQQQIVASCEAEEVAPQTLSTLEF